MRDCGTALKLWGQQVAQPVCVCLHPSATDMSSFKLLELFTAQSRDGQNQPVSILLSKYSSEEQASEFPVK